MRFSEPGEPASRWAGRSGLAVAAAAALFCLSAPAQAKLAGITGPLVSGSWNDSGSEYGDPLNWTPNTDIPNDVATFAITTLNFPTIDLPNFPWSVQTLYFAANARAYNIDTTFGNSFSIGGVTNASANVQTFNIVAGGHITFGDTANLPANITINVNDGTLWFTNTANAGNSVINISSTAGVVANFFDQSSAGNATITNYNTLRFNDMSTAGSADITNYQYVQMSEFSSAGTALITNNNNWSMFDNSTLGGSNFTNYSVLGFYQNSTAGSATILNDGNVIFDHTSTAGNATITNNGGISFTGQATAGYAIITNNNFIGFNDNVGFTGNTSAGYATFTNSAAGTIQFNGISSTEYSTAGYATFINDGTINFFGYSTAANATITNNCCLIFSDNATAGNARIDNTFFGTINFNLDSKAGNAIIANSGFIYFNDTSSAQNATITIEANAQIIFSGTATAANATIVNKSDLNDFYIGGLIFTSGSTAGSATITNIESAIITFTDNANAGSARINNLGFIFFEGNSSAQAASITIGPAGAAFFLDNAKAGTATIINSSQLSIGLIFANSADAEDATITTTAGAYTVFDGAATGGNARFIITGNGIVDFADPSAPVIAPGSVFNGYVTRTAGSIEGSGVFAIGGIDFVVGSNDRSTTVTGVIVDTPPGPCFCTPNEPGNLIKVGTGTLTLNGLNTYTGATWVQSGALIINGSITSNTQVFAGAILGGNGTIFGNVNISGILAPGNSIGTMTINGNLTFDINSIYRVEVSGPTQRDQTIVTGNINVDLGATVDVRAFNGGNGFGQSARLSILTTTGGVIPMTFAGVTDDLLFYDSSLDYDANNVYLVLARNAQTFAPFALTPNQRAVAAALDAAGANNNVYAAFQNTPEGVRRALDLLSGELYATLAGAFIDESRFFRNAIFSRLRNTAFTGFAGTLGYLSEEDQQALAYTSSVQRQQNPFQALRPADRGYEYWAQAFGSWAKYDSDSNAGNARRATGGVVTGMDRMLQDGIRAGLSAGYSNTQTRITDRMSKADTDTFHLAAYLSKLDGRWSYRTGAAAALHNVDSERNIIIDTVRANYFAFTGQIFGEIGYGITAGQFALEPFFNLALVHHYTNGFTENGANSALTTDGIGMTLGLSTIGMRFATRYNLANGQVIIPRASVAWQHAFGNLTPAATLTFQSTGTGMTIAGTPLSRDLLLTEAGFDVRMAPNRMFGVLYSATVANDSIEHALRGKYEWRF